MIVTLHDARTLCCAFPYSADAVARIKALPNRTYDPAGRTWLVPACDFDLLAEAFPDLQASADAWEAAYPGAASLLDRTLTFCLNLAALGISLVEQDGRIAAVGDGASPLLQAEVAAREKLIRVLLAQGWEFRAAARRAAGPDAAHWLAGVLDVGRQGGARQVEAATCEPATCEPAGADPLLAAVVAGMHSAAVRAAADAERRAARRRARMRRAAGPDAGCAEDEPRQAALL